MTITLMITSVVTDTSKCSFTVTAVILVCLSPDNGLKGLFLASVLRVVSCQDLILL